MFQRLGIYLEQTTGEERCMEVEKTVLLLYISEILAEKALISETEKNRMKSVINNSRE